MTGSIQFDKTMFAPGEPITGQVVVDVPPPSDVTFTAQFTVDSAPGTATGTTTVGSTVTYGDVSATGYDVVRDPDDPSRFTATPI